MLTPYMPQQEIAVMDFVIHAMRPRAVLEYGAGGSTVRWSGLPFIEDWVSVEHDPVWFGEVASSARSAHVVSGDPEVAEKLYEDLIEKVRERGIKVEKGVFGAHMEIESVNDGPVTFVLES